MSHNDFINPYTPPSEIAEPFLFVDASYCVLPRWVSIVWDTALFVVFGFYLPSMVDATSRLFAQHPLDLQTVSKLPERWVIAFSLFSLSAYFAVKRHVAWRVVYGVVALSFLLQHFPTGWFGDLITAAIAVAAFLPVFTHGFGWLGVTRSILVWNVNRPRLLSSHQ